jgi:hypothetical protein
MIPPSPARIGPLLRGRCGDATCHLASRDHRAVAADLAAGDPLGPSSIRRHRRDIARGDVLERRAEAERDAAGPALLDPQTPREI